MAILFSTSSLSRAPEPPPKKWTHRKGYFIIAVKEVQLESDSRSEKIIAICNDLDIVPILSGSLAMFGYAKSQNVKIGTGF